MSQFHRRLRPVLATFLAISLIGALAPTQQASGETLRAWPSSTQC